MDPKFKLDDSKLKLPKIDNKIIRNLSKLSLSSINNQK